VVWGTPSASALCLAGGVNLRLSEIEEKAGALEQVRLVVLSACESGITSLQTPDEFIGFPVAFLLAGAPGVMASLWRVDDASTAFLISRFYAYLLSAGAPASPAQALRRAQLDLCDLPPEDLELFAFSAAGGMDSWQQPQRHLSAWDRGGAPLQGRPIRERPYLWGAFTLVGA